MVRAALVIMAKDLRLRLRDRSVLLFALVVPLGLTLLFSFVFPEVDDLQVRAAVVDADGGAVAAGFVEGVVPALVDAGILELAEVDDEAAARDAVTSGDLDAAWLLPSGFSEAVGTGRSAQIDVVVASGAAIQGEIATRVAQDYASRLEQVGLAVATAAAASGSPPSPELVAALAAAAPDTADVLELRNLTVEAGEQLDGPSYLAAGMAAFFVFFVTSSGVTGMLEERQLGTLPRLLAAPVRPASIQLGKLAGAFVVGVMSMTVLAAASGLLLDAHWGPPVGVGVLIVAIVLGALGVMALAGAFARTLEQAVNFQSIVAVVLGLLGGVFFPVPGDTGVLRLASLVSPHGWFIRGLSELNATGDLATVVAPALAIVGFGVAAAIPAVVVQRRSQAW